MVHMAYIDSSSSSCKMKQNEKKYMTVRETLGKVERNSIRNDNNCYRHKWMLEGRIVIVMTSTDGSTHTKHIQYIKIDNINLRHTTNKLWQQDRPVKNTVHVKTQRICALNMKNKTDRKKKRSDNISNEVNILVKVLSINWCSEISARF